jgi:hypothetical protein
MNRALLSTLLAPLSFVAVFVVVALIIFVLPPIAGSPLGGAADASRHVPVVAPSATPSGWIPVDFGQLQISVPSSWTVLAAAGEGCGSDDAGVLILGQGSCTPTSSGTSSSGTSIVTVRSSKPPLMAEQSPALTVNGLAIYAPSVAPVYFVPALNSELLFSGPLQPRILRSVTYSPRAVALEAPRSSVPKGWRWVSFEGIRLAVPRSWVVNRTTHAPICGSDARVMRPGLTLATRPALPASCPPPSLLAEPAVAGVEVDGFSAQQVAGGTTPSPSSCLPRRRINNLRVCIQARPLGGVLIVQVSGSRLPTATVQIGMFGDGLAGKTVLDSLRRSSQGVIG